jgi:hypothetical protein
MASSGTSILTFHQNSLLVGCPSLLYWHFTKTLWWWTFLLLQLPLLYWHFTNTPWWWNSFLLQLPLLYWCFNKTPWWWGFRLIQVPLLYLRFTKTKWWAFLLLQLLLLCWYFTKIPWWWSFLLLPSKWYVCEVAYRQQVSKMTIIPWSVLFKNEIILVKSSIPWYNWWGQPGLRDTQEKCQKLGSQYMVTMWPVVIKQFQLVTNFYLDILDSIFQFSQSYMVTCGTEEKVNHIKKVTINTISHQLSLFQFDLYLLTLSYTWLLYV